MLSSLFLFLFPESIPGFLSVSCVTWIHQLITMGDFKVYSNGNRKKKKIKKIDI